MTNTATKTQVSRNASKAPRKPTKADIIIKLLGSKQGATIDDIRKATGWQAHSVRGFLSGTVKKRMGLSIENEPDKTGVRRYKIVKQAEASVSK
ncbi:MAG: DUF3489 domain-containing protein [Pseudomonadota bacterium]